MHHRITCMYFNFQENRVSRSVKTVRTNILAKNCNLHTFATTNRPSLFFLNRLLKTCILIKRICMRICGKIRFVDQSKPCTQNYLQKIASCINLKLPIVIFLKNRLFQTCVIVKRTCMSIFSKIGLVDQSKSCAFLI